MKLLKFIVRKERVEAVLRALREAQVARLFICHVHAVGSGVDPEDYRLSFEEGSAYTEKSKIEVVVPDSRADELIDVIRRHAFTGHQGDGIICVSPIERVVKIRTGDENAIALV